MTDRQVGGDGLRVDVAPLSDRKVGVAGLSLDVVADRGVAAVGLTLDVLLSGIGVAVRRPGGVDLLVDVVPVVARRQGNVGLMIDYVAALITGGIGWSGTQFVASDGTPVLWGATAFQVAGAYPPVQWEDGEFTT